MAAIFSSDQPNGIFNVRAATVLYMAYKNLTFRDQWYRPAKMNGLSIKFGIVNRL